MVFRCVACTFYSHLVQKNISKEEVKQFSPNYCCQIHQKDKHTDWFPWKLHVSWGLEHVCASSVINFFSFRESAGQILVF